MTGITLDVSGLSTKPDAQVTAEIKAVINGKCGISDQTTIMPFVTPLQMESTFTLSDFDLQVLTPYVGKYTGREVSDGTLNVRMAYNISDNKITATHKVLIRKFEFGGQVESKDALNLPFGLAVAILEDSNGRIDISLPVSGDMSKPDFKYWPFLGQAVRNFFMSLVTKPFMFLANMMGSDAGTQELGYVLFVPGRADLTEKGEAVLARLAEGLKNRPKLSLEINGSYDPQADWKAISADIFARDYDDLKRQAPRRDEKWILQSLYQRRCGIQALWSMIKDLNKKAGGTASQETINAEIKRRLIDEAPVDAAAFSELAGKRAQAVYDKIVAAGFDRPRVFIGKPRQVQADMGEIPLEFTLTVYDGAGHQATDSAPAEKPQ
jgi:outer membrane protein OmpA-like peptidoglycan-associated protein